MLKKLIIPLFLFLFSPAIVFCAENVTFSQSAKNSLSGQRTLTITYETAANGSLTTSTRISTGKYYGFILLIEHIPGSVVLTDGIADITLKTEGGSDVFGGALTNIDTDARYTTQSLLSSGSYAIYPIPIATTLQLDIASNSGVSATGTIIITLL